MTIICSYSFCFFSFGDKRGIYAYEGINNGNGILTPILSAMTDEIKVLIIEDEEIWSKGLAAILNDFGYTISGICADFESAVTLLNSADYDIVLTDINLNNRNSGIELGKMINTYYKKPFIFITANTDSNTINEAVKCGPSAYLTKPVNRTTLVATIQGAINNFNEKISPSYNAGLPDNDIFFVKQGSKYKKLN